MNFFKDLVELKKAGNLPDFSWAIQNGLIYFHLAPLLAALQSNFITGPDYLDKSVVFEFLKNQPGFLRPSLPKRFGNKIIRCVVFQYSKAPAELLELLHE